MASLEKALPYDSKAAKIGIVFSSLTLPIWGIIAPLTLLMFILIDVGQLFFHNEDLFKCLGYTFGAALFFISGVVATGILKDNQLRVSRDGLNVPLFLTARNHFERFIDYRDIVKIIVQGDDYKNGDVRLHFMLKGGGTIDINGRSLDHLDLEHLLVSLTLWCEPSALNERVIELKDSLAESDQYGLVSYTKMWEEELGNRYTATAFMPLTPGTRLLDGQLKIIRQLTFGGWSAVYLCQESNTRLKVLKESVLPPTVGANMKEKAEAMFLKEAVLLMKLSHPNIVKVHEHFVEEGRHYMLLDYINGQNMRQLVKTGGALHEFDVLNWAFTLTDILAYLHEQTPPLIHRDLSPDNIVIDSDGNLMLIDFGAANELLGTATGTLVGKQCYISPEQFRGKAQASSDLYSLGATLHYLLTASDPEALSSSSPRELVPSVSLEMDKLVRDLTAIDVNDRPKSAREVKEHLLDISKSLKLVGAKR
ncbi:MAG: serine/threonine protein kinase [Cyanobacteria bacterium REEB67]|nr:serine/threonine protein kinase [Cyanobacteria bacterium REEB67]